jgi:hypothetical protein
LQASGRWNNEIFAARRCTGGGHSTVAGVDAFPLEPALAIVKKFAAANIRLVLRRSSEQFYASSISRVKPFGREPETLRM